MLSFSDFGPGRMIEGCGELMGANRPTWKAYARHFGPHETYTQLARRMAAE